MSDNFDQIHIPHEVRSFGRPLQMLLEKELSAVSAACLCATGRDLFENDVVQAAEGALCRFDESGVGRNEYCSTAGNPFAASYVAVTYR